MNELEIATEIGREVYVTETDPGTFEARVVGLDVVAGGTDPLHAARNLLTRWRRIKWNTSTEPSDDR